MPLEESSEKSHQGNNNQPHDSLPHCLFIIHQIVRYQVDENWSHDRQRYSYEIQDASNDKPAYE